MNRNPFGNGNQNGHRRVRRGISKQNKLVRNTQKRLADMEKKVDILEDERNQLLEEKQKKKDEEASLLAEKKRNEQIAAITKAAVDAAVDAALQAQEKKVKDDAVENAKRVAAQLV